MFLVTNLPIWLPVAIHEIGVSEIPGKTHNERILEYLKTCETLPIYMQQEDETAWCSAFVNWCMEQVDIKGTDKANARSWLDWGKKIDKPTIGCVTVFYRGSKDGWSGHVGFYMGENNGYIDVLGGNQSNKVCIKPYAKSRLLGYRVL